MDAHRLMTLASVEDRGGVVAAAKSLHLTPSAVSQQLRHLEREATVSLLDRSGRQVRLTEAGRRLAARGRRIAREVVLATDDLAPWTDSPERTITIAAFQTVVVQILAPLLGDGRIADAGVSVRLVEMEGPPALEALYAGQVDVVMQEEPRVRGAEPNRFPNDPETRLVIDDRYRVVVPRSWDVDESTVTALQADLAQRPWLSQGDSSVGGTMLARLMRTWGFSARVVHIFNEYSSAVALVEAGVGATLAPHLALPMLSGGTDVSGRGVRLLENTPDLGTRRVRALVRPSRRLDPAVDRLLALVADQARTIGLEARQVVDRGTSA